MKTVLYARTSTAEQTIEHQQIQAESKGYRFDKVITDDGVSGVGTKLQDREGGKRLDDLLNHGDTLVVRWVDRLGRDYDDVTANMRHFMQKGVIVKTIVNDMTFDGSNNEAIAKATRDAYIGFMAAMAQNQAEVTRDSQKAGIAYAKQNGSKKGDTAYKGRQPTYNRALVDQVVSMKAEGKTVIQIAEATKLTRGTVYRIQGDTAAAYATAAEWEAPTA